MSADEVRDGVPLTNLDQPLFDGAEATKRDLVEYGVAPADFTLHTAPGLLGDGDPWADHMPEPQPLSSDLIEEGRAIPGGRVQAMHEGKRRARARRA